MTTGSSGGGSVQVPEAAFVATADQTYTVSCDDQASPSTPVTKDWSVP
jgi:hypothetical protein